MDELIRGSSCGDVEVKQTPIYAMMAGGEASGWLSKFEEPSFLKKVRSKPFLAAFKFWAQMKRSMGLGKITAYTPMNLSAIPNYIFRDPILAFGRSRGINKVGDLYCKSGCKSFMELQSQYGLPRTHFLKFLQIRNFFHSQKYDRSGMLEIPVVEAVKSGAKIGKLYTLLTELQSDDMVHQNERWTVRFGLAEEWMDQSLVMADTTLLSANLKTQHYKTLMDLYYTPAKLKRWGKSSGICTRCGEAEAEITHMFFACPMLRGILNEIEVFLKKITGCNVQVTVMLVVLGVNDSSESMEPALYKIRRFLFLTMAIYRLCIATDWIKKEPPTFEG
ncbi:hypothetical protein NDU88_002233 [Pleurodeles waltl]|uniref:Reverse transcriptase zinc-binding domain-containing protein n=1 Tax=Pleurodeles waltl TaxID=8319 RepID=A0AAV7W2E5_PLEWA|nr:hypothetical protein NDU88_002233 [Pleurodeles waltl]